MLNRWYQYAGGAPPDPPSPPSGGSANEIAWTPNMLAPRVRYSATDQSSFKDTSGVTATSGTAVETWQDVSGNNAHAVSAANSNGASTASTRGVVGPAGSEITVGSATYFPLRMGAGVLTNRYNSPTSVLSMASGAIGDKIMVFSRVRPPATALGRTLIGNSSGNFNSNINISDTTVRGRVTVGSVAGVLKTDTTERLEILCQLKTVTTGNNYQGRYNGREATNEESSGTAGLGASLSDVRLVIGNVYNGSLGVDADFFEVAVISDTAGSRGNLQRYEGWIAHTYGVQSLLPADHPYKSAPPMVPAGTTSTVGWVDVNPMVVKQTFKGFMVEIQGGAYEVGGVRMTNDVGGVPYELTTSERTRFATDVLGYGNGFRYLRWAGGLHQNRAESADRKELLPHYTTSPASGSTQLTASVDQAALIKDLLTASGKPIEVAYEEWGCASHWRGGTFNSASSLSYPDPVADPTGYATWIDEFATAYVNNMKRVDAAGFKITMVAGFNEAGNVQNGGYPHVHLETANDAAAFIAFMEKVIEKIDAETWANTSAANILLALQSWNGPTGFASGNIKASTALMAKLWQWTDHQITDFATDGNNVPTYTTAQRGTIGVSINEHEFFDSVRNAHTTTYGADADKFRSGNIALVALNAITRNDAAFHMLMIHAAKPTYDNADNLGYALTEWRSSLDGTNNTGLAQYDALGVGEWDYYEPNWNAVAGFLKYVPWDSVRLQYEAASTPAAGQQIVHFTTPAGKRVVAIVNRTNADWVVNTFVGPGDKTLAGHRYRADLNDVTISTITGTVLSCTVPAYGIEFWVES